MASKGVEKFYTHDRVTKYWVVVWNDEGVLWCLSSKLQVLSNFGSLFYWLSFRIFSISRGSLWISLSFSWFVHWSRLHISIWLSSVDEWSFSSEKSIQGSYRGNVASSRFETNIGFMLLWSENSFPPISYLYRLSRDESRHRFRIPWETRVQESKAIPSYSRFEEDLWHLELNWVSLNMPFFCLWCG